MIFAVETFEKEDLLNPNLAQEYITSAERREFTASQFLLNSDYARLARMLAAWDRKVAQALNEYHNK